MFEPDHYALLDFGGGRKLERFGGAVLDRPSPAAEGTPIADPELWRTATARFEIERGGNGAWEHRSPRVAAGGDDPWLVRHGDSSLAVQLSASGNVGLFPEQAPNWDWIAEQVRRCSDRASDDRPRVLNLFAYTGGASLAAAFAGAEVTHVDSSGPTVAAARRNAEVSGAADLPVRWLVEDAMKFVAREERRGNRYDGIIADPPTYGHGPKGRPFKFRQHLDELMASCGTLLNRDRPNGGFLLFSCHAPGFGVDDAVRTIVDALPDVETSRIAGLALTIQAMDDRHLEAGVAARVACSA